MNQPFKDKVAMVTGGASGIGKATVLKFIAMGAKVAIIDSDELKGRELKKEVTKLGGDALYIKCDVSNETEVKACIKNIVETAGRLDYCFNNAGIGGEFAKLQDYSVDDFDRVIAINLRSVFLCMKYQIPYLLQQKHSVIVNCASVLSQVGYENDSAYVASKYAVLGLTKNAALEYAATGLRINAVSPGFTRTPMVDKGDECKLEALGRKHPIGRLADPAEIANGVTWLCSEEASFAIGLNLLLDGGYTLI